MGRRPTPKPPDPVVRSFYALLLAGSPGHVHYGSLFVHGKWSVVRRELEQMLAGEASESDLWDGTELDLAVFEDGALRRSVDLIPHLRLHQLGPRRALGRPRKLVTLLDDPPAAQKIAAAIRTGEHRYVLRLRWSDLKLPRRLRNPLREGERVCVPQWTDFEELGLPDWIVGVGTISTLSA